MLSRAAALLTLARVALPVLAGEEAYTTNTVCHQHFCIDPVFPALTAITALEGRTYECQKDMNVARSMLHFCHGQVTYPFGLPRPGVGEEDSTTAGIAKIQEQEAITYYAYHLAGMGYEFWENRMPNDVEDECVKSVWRLTCLTFFPKCNEVEDGKYMRPCRSSCENYRKKCRVECCDESVSCVFEHTQELTDGTSLLSTGYVDHDGPSNECTGGSPAPASTLVALLVVLSAAVLTTA